MPRGFLVKRQPPVSGRPRPGPEGGQQPQHLFHSVYLYSEPPLDLSVKAAAPITPPATPSPSSPGRRREGSTNKKTTTTTTPRRHKAVRRLAFDEDTSSPVSGTIIRELSADEAPLVVRKGDIDPAFNVVEVTDEAKAELAKIENRIGAYICRLCRQMYEDAFSLAQHRCSRIVHVEYRCPDCDKVFNCPANLASHRRWHRPRGAVPGATAPQPIDLRSSDDADSNGASEGEAAPYPCSACHKRFRRQAYLRKHLATHEPPPPVLPPSTTTPPPAVSPGFIQLRTSPPPTLSLPLAVPTLQPVTAAN